MSSYDNEKNQIRQHLWHIIQRATRYVDDAGCDWFTIGDTTHIGFVEWVVSTDPEVARCVNAVNALQGHPDLIYRTLKEACEDGRCPDATSIKRKDTTMQFVQADHITPDRVGTRAFHLDHITNFSEDDYAYLFIILAEENRAVPYVVVYNYPPSFNPVMEELTKNCPLHMVGFAEDEDGTKLTDATTVRGDVCPCRCAGELMDRREDGELWAIVASVSSSPEEKEEAARELERRGYTVYKKCSHV